MDQTRGMDIADDPQRATRDLLDRTATVRHGFLDVLGESMAPDLPTVAQRAMHNPLLAGVYERLWRPVAFYVASGVTTGAEQRRAGCSPARRAALLGICLWSNVGLR